MTKRAAAAPPAMPANLTVEEAYCALASQAIYLDGSVAREEQDALIEHLAGIGPFARSGADVEATVRRVNRMVREVGQANLLRAAAAALPLDHRGSAYAMTASLAGSDHVTDAGESDYLEHVRGLLGLTPEQASDAIRAARVRSGR